MPPMNNEIKILIAEHNVHDLETLHRELKRGGLNYISKAVQNEVDYTNALREFVPDIILSDYSLPCLNGTTTFSIREKLAQDTPFILVSAIIGEEDLIEFIKAGITDYVLKDKLFTIVTKIKRALQDSKEKQLKNEAGTSLISSENKYRRIVENAQEGIWLFDEDGNTILVNSKMAGILEYSPEEMMGKPHQFFMDEESKKNTAKSSLHSRTEGKQNQEFKYITRSSKEVWTKQAINQVFDKSGNYKGLLAMVNDITESRDAAAEIKRSEQRYRTLFEQNLAGIYQSAVNGIILNCNRAFAEMLQYDSPEELIGINIYEHYLSPEARDSAINELLLTEKLSGYETVLKCRDESLLHVLGNISLRNDELTGGQFFDGVIVDITRRKRTEQEMSWLINNTEESFILLDSDLKIASFNNQAEKLYRRYFKKELFKGACILDYVQPERSAVIKEIYKTVLSGAEVADEITITEQSVAIKSFVLKYKPAKDEQGQIIGVFISAIDITEKRRSEHQLITQERRYRALVENGADAVVIITADMKPVYISPSIEKVLGYTEKEAGLIDFFTLFHRDDLAEVKRVWDKVLESPGVPVAGQSVRLLHKDNEWRWCEATMTNMLHDPDINGIVDNFRDVTDKVKAGIEIREKQKLLEQAEANYREIFEKASDGIFIHELETGRVLDMNEKACEMLGCTREEMMRGDAAAFMSRATGYTPAVAMEYMRKAATEGPQLFEWRSQSMDGTLNWVEVNLKLACIAGTDRILAFFRTINDRKNAEIQKEFERRDKEALINTTEDLIWSVNSGFKLMAANRSFINSIKKTVDIILQPGDDLLLEGKFPAEFVFLWKALYTNALKGKSFIEEIYTPAWGKFSESWAEARFNPIYEGDSIIGVACYTRDTTEKKIAEEKLKRSEARLSEAQSVANVGSWETDLATFEVIWSDETCRIFGIENCHPHTSHENFLKFVHPEDKGAVDLAFLGSLKSDSLHSIEHRIITPGGIVKVVEERWHIVNDTRTSSMRAIGTVQDITRRKKTEETVKASELRYRSLIEQATDAICISDATLKFIDINQYACEVFGYTLEEALQLSLTDIFFPEDIVGNPLKIDELKFGKTIRNERRLKRKDGTGVDMEVSTKLMEDGRLIMFGHDITERKKAEQLISESEAKFRAFFENSLDGILLTITDGDILAANPAACKIFQMTEEEICTAGKYGIIDIKDSRTKALITAHQLSGKAKGELTCLRKDGSKFPGEMSSVLFKDSYGQERTSIIIRDISERKQAEEKISATSKDLQYALNDLNKIMDSSLDVICAIDAKGNFIKVSAASEAVWGYRPEELIGKPVINFVYHEDNQQTNQTTAHVMAVNDLNHFENRYIRKDGTLVPIEWSARWDEKDQVRYGVARDVTVKKRMEKALENERKRFLDLFQQAPSCIGVLNGPGHIYEMANPLYLKLTGRKDVIGKRVRDVFSDVEGQGFFELLDKIYTTGETFSGTESLIKLDVGNGELTDFYADFIYQPYKNADGIVEGIFFFANDVTEQVISRKKIEQSELRLKEAQALSHISNWQIDLLTGIHTWSDEFYHILGIRPGDVQASQEAFLSLIHPDDFEYANEMIQKTFVTFEASSFYARINTDDRIQKHVYSEWEFEFDTNNKPIRLYGILQDITERKKAEAELRITNERLSFHLENTPLGFIEWDDQLHLKSWSKQSEEIFGWSAEEFIEKEKNGYTQVYIEDQPKMLKIAEQLIKGEVKNNRVQNRNYRKDGAIIWCEWFNSVLKDKEGRVITIMSLVQDITEKKELEVLLDKSSNLARIGSWEVNLVTNVVYWSPIIKKIHEVTDDDIPDFSTVLNFIKEGESRELITKNILESIDYGKSWISELQLITAKGNELWISASGDAEIIDGKCVRLYGTFQDIDIRKRAELAALATLEEKNTILESIGDAFFALDKTWMVTYWNKEAEKMLVRPKAEIVGHNFWEAFPDWVHSLAFQKFHTAIETNQVIDFEINYAPLEKWYEAISYPSDSGLSVYFKDVTQRKISDLRLVELNKNLQNQASKLAISNDELEQFAYVASHDLQEPLRMITSFLSLLESKYGNVIDDKAKKYIYFAVDGAKRMRGIILDLLEFSRVGRTEDKVEVVNLNEIGKEILALLKKEIADKKAIIRIDPLSVVNSYKAPLRQVFQNLISNAIKYCPEDASPQIHVSMKELKDQWQFAVSDKGIGISEAYFSKIFVIFQRLHNKDEFSGTGIGLAITKKIIEMLGGQIWVVSEIGRGSTFYFTLPKN
ncbi:MAG: domain S-box protein [Ferruginibacter sp.]|nr:domain S-box protein [Ferruginibacter sp.]